VSEPDLFVVCKNCSSEVSPYVTECPYCGQRVRKRAPKLERTEEALPRPKKRRAPRLSRLRRDEIPGIAAEGRPYATAALIVLSLAATLALSTGEVSEYDLGAVIGPIGDEWWRLFAAPLVHDNAGYQFVALVACGIFGMHLERRFGMVAAALTFVAAGAAGAALSDALEVYPAIGANGAALGLLAAWLVDDRLAARRGDDRENDLLGVGVIAALLLALPLADDEASWAAGVGGAAAGAVIGTLISPFRR
jgi:membrane associated rhomboid family serine protease